jgi:exodeoxyribonuclease V alpha subunit
MANTAPAIDLDPAQRDAVELTLSEQIGIVTGGPGTGKSTCLRYALDELDARGESYALAAPTGKAAKRIEETTGRSARTIHRLLEYTPRYGGMWVRNRDNPLEADVVIVDESSMVDVELAAHLTNAIDPARTRLILIGDADQLPPVGPGRVFGDLVDAGAVPIVRLQTLHRAARESWVCQNAPRVLAGEVPDLTPRRDFMWVEVDRAGDILEHVRRMVCEHLPEFAELGVGDCQALIPQRPGVAGIIAANRMLQGALNPPRAGEPSMQRGHDDDDRTELRVGDRVIQTKNNYELGNGGVFNGEIGEVVDLGGGVMRVALAGREVVSYTYDQAAALQLAYALTVHRAQGSEFPWVVVVCHSTHSFILSRQLVYTAITRAKVGVVLIGDRKGLQRALSDARPPTRNTALIQRMRGEL